MTTEAEGEELSRKIEELEKQLHALRLQQKADKQAAKPAPSSVADLPLELQEYIRYGRQMILPQIGLPGQLAIKNASVLVIGAGGLGCPALLYLAAAGVGTIGIADLDCVELSNLHRQVLHRTSAIGEPKVASAKRALQELNPLVHIRTFEDGITPNNAVSMVSQFDAVLDCTDTPSTRYLISDTCVALLKPLISGSALGTEGQIAVYGYKGGPCYRCIFPTPPPPEAVLTCGEGGILGPVVGMIGVMQALETIKVIVVPEKDDTYKPSMTIFSAFDSPQWRTFRLRPRKSDCPACGLGPSITTKTIEQGDYANICRRVVPTEIVERVSPQEYSSLRSQEHVLIDVRDSTQFGICQLPNSINIPITDLVTEPSKTLSKIPRNIPAYVVCRFGNDSQDAVQIMRKMENPFEEVKDIKGGLNAWTDAFPEDKVPKY